MSAPDLLRLDGLTRSFGAAAPAVDGVSLALGPGRFFALLGPSGCGKTTLLRLIGGYARPDVGRVVLAGDDVTDWPPERRRIGMVFQHYALFPHLSARGNVSFGLEVRGLPRAEVRRRVEAMLDRIGLNESERGRRPRELSGGQQQRVALARALVIEPTLLLLDEPLANLDRTLREQLRGELRDLHRRTGVTTLMVTHDHDEAMALADRVGVMGAGRLLQVGPPEELYRRPADATVARLLGNANLLPIRRRPDGSLDLGDGLMIACPPGLPPVATGLLVVRPEDCRLGPIGDGAPGWPGRVVDVAFLGADWLVTVRVGDGTTLRALRRRSAGAPPAPGDEVAVIVDPADCGWVRDPAGAPNDAPA